MHLKDDHENEMKNMQKRFEKENEENKIKFDRVIEEKELMKKDLANANQDNEELRRNIDKNNRIYFEGVKKLENERRRGGKLPGQPQKPRSAFFLWVNAEGRDMTKVL